MSGFWKDLSLVLTQGWQIAFNLQVSANQVAGEFAHSVRVIFWLSKEEVCGWSAMSATGEASEWQHGLLALSWLHANSFASHSSPILLTSSPLPSD